MSFVELPTVLPFQPARMSVDRYHELVRVGAYNEHDRVELLHGIVTEQKSKNPPHRTATRRCDLALAALVPIGLHVQNQEPITLATSEPEPDVAVVRGKLEDYSQRHPSMGEIDLAIEVADTSLVTDRFKAQIYAGAGIPVYWIVNLQNHTIEVHSSPICDATPPRYESMSSYAAGEEIGVVIGDVEVGRLRVGELLP